MSTSLMRDQQIWFDKYNLTGTMNSMGLAYGADMLDITVLGNTTHIMQAGLKTLTASIAGLGDASTYDAALFSELGASSAAPLTFAATSSGGALAYFFKGIGAKYNQDGKVGNLLQYTFDVDTQSRLVRGTLCENQTGFNATAHGTARQIGAVSATQKIFAAIHVLAAAGSSPTLDLNIKSNSTNSFAGAETSRIAFTQMTTTTSQWQELAGAITDTWWCPEFTVSGSGATFDFVLSIGIG